MSDWCRIAFQDALTHAVHRDLMLPLIADMAERGHPVKDFEAEYGRENAKALRGNPVGLTEWSFDLGGARYKNTPTVSFVVDGLTIEVDCDHCPPVLAAARRSEVRTFATGERYHKLKFWHHATVLTPAQHLDVIRQLETLAGVAQERSDAFYAELEAARSNP